MTILEQLQADIDALTEEQIERSAITIIRDGETILGQIANQHSKQVWALAFEYDRRSRKLVYDGMYKTSDKSDRTSAIETGRYFDALADAVRSIAWCAMKAEIGPSAWEAGEIGLREGFLLVKIPTASASNPTLNMMRLPASLGALLEGFRDAAKAAVALEEDDDDDRPKPPRRTRHRKPS